MTTLLICLGALLTLAAIGYLAACAGPGRHHRFATASTPFPICRSPA